MSQNFEDRLRAIVAQKKANDDALAEAQTEAKNRAEADARKRALAKEKWTNETFPLLRTVVQKANQGMAAAGMELKINGSQKSESPAIAQVSCDLFSDGIDTKKHLVFNVNAFGKIVLVQLIPHTGPSRDTHIDTTNEEELTDVILGFLELAMTKPKR